MQWLWGGLRVWTERVFWALARGQGSLGWLG